MGSLQTLFFILWKQYNGDRGPGDNVIDRRFVVS